MGIWVNPGKLSINLVGGHLDESGHTRIPGGIQEDPGPHNIRLNKRSRPLDRAIHVALCRQVHDGIDPVTDGCSNDLGVGDVTVHEPVARIALDVGHILRIARIRELVEVGHLGAAGQGHAYEGGADEAATPGDEELHGYVSPMVDESPTMNR